jgi:S-adenosylmethionine:tRNA ribosyltransferase-isomerase
MKYSLSDFDYHLPAHLIAQEPATPRDHSRLLVYERASGRITDDHFFNLPDHLTPGTTLVMNNSRVGKARLLFGNTEVFVLQQSGPDTVEALVRPGRKFRAGTRTALTSDITAETLSVDEGGTRTIRFNLPLNDPHFHSHRHTPFPPYIRQNEELADRYQTVIAKSEGSKAAPTAGLHFTEELLDRIALMGIPRAEITLHVGLGTFAPVKTDNIDDHRLHEEMYVIDPDTASLLTRANHITAVGTTSARVLESAVMPIPADAYIPTTGSANPELKPAASASAGRHPVAEKSAVIHAGRHFEPREGSTDIFIKPGYTFRGLDQLITNFHLPKSTLLMMVAAFTGYDEMRRIYDHAIRQEYRFYSFGDAMIVI